MPILPPEPAFYPECLFEATPPDASAGQRWQVFHTKPRQEKSLARRLHSRGIAYYLPVVRRRLALRGRVLNSHVPLFPGYLFLLGDREARLHALETGCVVRTLDVADQPGLWGDLRQIQRLIASGAPLTPEERLTPGMAVEITRGPLAGLRGKIVRAASGSRFVVEVHFIQRGASALLDDFALAQVIPPRATGGAD
jgi:transcription antitermination factor NusG